VDPIEKKPLVHFHPGNSVLSFGTAGCNLACRFCQNWDISKSRELTYRLTKEGQCPDCGAKVPGHFDAKPRDFGRRRLPVTLW
jgi:pyruvate-formate lyase-activating enzyme